MEKEEMILTITNEMSNNLTNYQLELLKNVLKIQFQNGGGGAGVCREQSRFRSEPECGRIPERTGAESGVSGGRRFHEYSGRDR